MKVNGSVKGSFYPLATPGLIDAYAQATLGSTSVTVAAGSKITIPVKIAAPTSQNASTFPVFSGFIKLQSSDGAAYTIPYLGMAAAMFDMKVIDTGSAVAGATVPLIADNNLNIQSGAKTYTFTGSDYPNIFLRLVGEEIPA